jgi:hypothetical protein
MRGLFRFLSCAVILAVASAGLFAGTIVIGTPSNGPNMFPFGGPVGGYEGTRYQQAYAAADFTGLGVISIYGIDFYDPSQTAGTGNFRSGTYDFYLSTITAGIDSLDNTSFDANLGGNNALFASLTLSGVAPPTFTFTGTPFTFDPGAGNLLLDIRISNTSGSDVVYFAYRNGANGIFSRYHNFGTGTIGMGLVTGFDYTTGETVTGETVPEPASGLLVGLGALALAAVVRRRRSRGLPG